MPLASPKKFRQLYPFMPKDTFRMLICGNSGSGKTNLLYHMLIEPLLYYDKIYLYAKNLEQDKYQNLMKEMNEASSEEAGYNIMTVSSEKNQSQIVDYFIQGRQKLF